MWNYTINSEGTLSGPGGSVPIFDSYIGSFVITSNSVTDEGTSCVWSYDGSTLLVSEAGIEDLGWDPELGDISGSFTLDLIIPVKAGATAAGITGNMHLIYFTENYGEVEGVLQLTGNMAKQ